MANNCKIAIFFEDHRDTRGLEAITTLLPFFKEHLFETIALEETAEKNQRDILKQYSQAYKKVQEGQMQSQKDFIKDNYLFVKNAISNGFSLKSIDVGQKDFYRLYKQNKGKEQQILSKLQSYMELTHLDPESLMKDDYVVKLWIQISQTNFITERDKNFVKEIDAICQKTNAGIIGTFGVAHARIVDGLKEMGYNDIKAFYLPFTILKEAEDLDFQDYMYQYNPGAVYKTLFASTDIIDDKYSGAELVAYIQGEIESLVGSTHLQEVVEAWV